MSEQAKYTGPERRKPNNRRGYGFRDREGGFMLTRVRVRRAADRLEGKVPEDEKYAPDRREYAKYQKRELEVSYLRRALEGFFPIWMEERAAGARRGKEIGKRPTAKELNFWDKNLSEYGGANTLRESRLGGVLMAAKRPNAAKMAWELMAKQ